MADHTPLIEQLDRWAKDLEAVLPSFTTRVTEISSVIAGMREVAADLARDGQSVDPFLTSQDVR